MSILLQRLLRSLLGSWKRMLYDMDTECDGQTVGVAFLHAKELERVIVNPPAEWKRRYPGFMWLLKKCLYGRRAGPKRWYQTFRETLINLGLEASLVQPSLIRHPTSGVVMEAHVDDIEITGPDKEVDKILQRLGEIFLLKVAPIVEAGTISVFLDGER